MQVRTQFSIFLVNRPGVMATVTGAMAQAGVNLDALSLADSGESGVLRVVADKPDLARKVLTDTHDRWTETDVIVLNFRNKPGQFAALTRKLGDAKVNIVYAYVTAGAIDTETLAVLKVADIPKAQAVLAGK